MSVGGPQTFHFRAEEGGGEGLCGEFLKKRGEVGLGRKKSFAFLFLFLTHESVIRKKK